MPELILALDVGTTTARAALVSPDGRLTGLERARLKGVATAPGRLEQDASAIWRTVRRLIGAVLAREGLGGADLAAIGLATQRTSVVVWDRRTGVPLAPMVAWSDLRGVERAAQLRGAGFPLVAQQAAAKLEAVVAAIEGARSLAAQGALAFGGIDSFLIWKLSGGGAHVTDRSQAWPTGYLDLASLDWNRALIAHQNLDPRIFPKLADTCGVVASASRRVLGAEVPIAADIADQQSALTAHGGDARPGAAKITYGTSATANLATGEALVFKSAAIPPFILSSSGGQTAFCLEGMVLSAGAALDWLVGLLRLGGPSRLEAAAASVEGSDGVVFLPALSGLGAPNPDPARRALIGGLTGAAGVGHIARAAYEGVAFRMREVIEAMVEMAPAPEAIGVDGGLSASDLFLQVQADLLARPVRRHAVAEATVLGAALCAGRGVGLLSEADAAGFVRYERTFAPRLGAEEAAARYRTWRDQVGAGRQDGSES